MCKIFLNVIFCMESESESENEVAQSCPTLCDPMDCSLPGSSIHGILQATVLEWVAISCSRGSSWPRDRTQVSHIAGRHFNLWATREAPFCIEYESMNDFYLFIYFALLIFSFFNYFILFFNFTILYWFCHISMIFKYLKNIPIRPWKKASRKQQ